MCIHPNYFSAMLMKMLKKFHHHESYLPTQCRFETRRNNLQNMRTSLQRVKVEAGIDIVESILLPVVAARGKISMETTEAMKTAVKEYVVP